jgi:hypothetical protein
MSIAADESRRKTVALRYALDDANSRVDVEAEWDLASKARGGLTVTEAARRWGQTRGLVEAGIHVQFEEETGENRPKTSR